MACAISATARSNASALAFDGFVDTWEALSGADVVVVPSRVEPFGNVAVEAGLAGRPVVASRVGGLPEIVRNRETGLLVAPERVDELAAALEVLARRPELRACLGAAAHERCTRLFGVREGGPPADARLLEIIAAVAAA